MKKVLLKTSIAIIILYIIICGGLYAFQDRMVFPSPKLDRNYKFEFSHYFEEMSIKMEDGKLLDAVLFKSENSKGLIFYLHGNGESLNKLGEDANIYTDLGYDFFMFDYRGYGKSEGEISNQGQFFQDMQTVYNEMKKSYTEDKIIILGFSIGTGPAAKLASTNNPKLLILQAPYYSLADLMEHRYKIVPTFLLKYKFDTYKYLKDCRIPVVIFHGTADDVVYYGSSLKLKENFKSSDTLITLNGLGHGGMKANPQYLPEIKKILN